jgi:hypothetical protein
MVTITTIQPSDAVGTSRLTLNSNFQALKAGIDSSHLLLNPTTAVLSGVKSATITDSALSLSNYIFTVSQGSRLLGNVIMGTTGASTSVTINGTGGFSVPTGTINAANISTTGTLTAATLSTTGEIRQPGLSTAFSGIIGLTGDKTLTITGLKYVVLRNDGSSYGLTASLPIGTAGQVIEIFHVLGTSSLPVIVNTSNFTGLTGGIRMYATGDTLKCVYDGARWYLMNYSSARLATGADGATSSITFTTTAI